MADTYDEEYYYEMVYEAQEYEDAKVYYSENSSTIESEENNHAEKYLNQENSNLELKDTTIRKIKLLDEEYKRRKDEKYEKYKSEKCNNSWGFHLKMLLKEEKEKEAQKKARITEEEARQKAWQEARKRSITSYQNILFYEQEKKRKLTERKFESKEKEKTEN
jgi:hypothetical protein